MKQKMPGARRLHFLVIVFCTLLLTAFFACQNSVALDEALAYALIDAVFLAIVLYMLESGRLRRAIGASAASRYERISFCYGAFCALFAGFYFLPEFACPAAAPALFLSVVSNAEIGIGLSAFLCALLSAAKAGGIYELCACVVLIFIGAQAAYAMRQKNPRFWGCVMLFSASVSVPALFSYLSNKEADVLPLAWNAAFSAVFLYVFCLLADRLYDTALHEEEDAYERIMKEGHPLVGEMKNYATAEYVHAMKVATVARKCASEIGANELLAAAAGFYYRLGALEGEPYVENGVRLAEKSCFPIDVIQILSEYNGEERLPQTKESAIVHMADACIKRIELLSSQNLSSSWNQDMAIYQTLNELSATGIYDESGLSMNQFLKIRELLVREEMGYDAGNGKRSGSEL